MACVNGVPQGSGDAQILGGTGALSGVSAAVNGLVNLTVGVPTIGTEVGVKLYTNEQSQSGTSMSVTALRIELVAKALTLPLLNASVIVGNSTASMPDCKPTVTLNPLPPINAGNQSSVPISGSCSTSGGNVAISSNPAGVSQSLPCSASGTYAGSVNAQGLPDGTVTITATQTVAGQPRYREPVDHQIHGFGATTAGGVRRRGSADHRVQPGFVHRLGHLLCQW